ncbi:butyrophilin-like protein 1 [Archocentrus centrarchus]|uniref:butyrophilin-like protein 1 n=1 Tax=Archocentrus centrarchus TaxID=63155 RepID=UPI0011EA2872|nr:butyrophilin-like protein 1 [Archocentrus centrarchus]
MLQSSKACADMQLLPRVCFCFLTLSGLTFGDRSGPRVRVVVSEGSDAILHCSLSTKESVVQKLFDWRKMDQKIKEVFMYDAGAHYNNGRPGQDEQFNGRVSHFPDQLQFGNTSIIIRNTIVADSGDYTCEFPHVQSEETTNITLVVEGRLKVRNVPGAAPEPSVTNLDQTNDWALLQCDVQGAYPKPTVEWRDSDNQAISSEEPQVSERGGRFNITLNTTVKKSDRYRCVATQKEIHHQTYKQIKVHFNDSTGWKTAFIVLLVVVVVVVLLVAGILLWCFKQNKKKKQFQKIQLSDLSNQHDQNQPAESQVHTGTSLNQGTITDH